ncbi:MAG: tetratricopeptide repeat-containing sensor histidine kinase [Bacteroidetes bacterium]|nr:tetratricopeptide repeat-containing sensor histidine kinase [Bacteroidota bacterium]
MIILLLAHFSMLAQAPDISKIAGNKDKIAAWIAYCETLRQTSQFQLLSEAATKGLSLIPPADNLNAANLLYLKGIAFYYQIKFDSAQYFLYQGLSRARQAHSGLATATISGTLIPFTFQLRQQDKTDSFRIILQNVTDTAKDPEILQIGYAGLGAYYQQKAYYSTAQDYLIKSIELRKKEIDTTQNIKKETDYAVLCYNLYKLYGEIDGANEKAIDALNEGRPFMQLAPSVSKRYLSSYIEAFCSAGKIDSALHYMQQLQPRFKNTHAVPSEAVTSNLNIAVSYMDKKQYANSLPYLHSADTFSTKSQSPLLIYQSQLCMGRYLEETGNYPKAIEFLSKALPVAKQINKRQYLDDLKYMSLAQLGAGNNKEALQFYQQYISGSDSLTREKLASNFADQEIRYQTSKKEQQIAVLNRDNQVKVLELKDASRLKWFLLAGLIVLALFSLMLYFFYREKGKANQLLNDKNAELDKLNMELTKANNTKAKLFGIISHDLRAPVGRIAKLIRLKKENPKVAGTISSEDYDKMLDTGLDKILDTMEDLLVWSKSQMEHFTPNLLPTNISPIAEKEIQFLQGLINEKNITLNNRLPASFKQNTDENFLSVIVRNLLLNAIKASNAGGQIDISGANNQLLITNSSPGADAARLNGLLSGTTPNTKNDGLGLQIVKDLSAAIDATLVFKQQDAHFITAVLSWNK